MLIKVNNLKDGTHLYNLDEPIENIGLEEPFIDKVNIDLNLQKLHNQIVLETKIQAKANFECDRCTSVYTSNLETAYKMVYLFGSNADEENETLNVTYLRADVSEIVLDNDIRDYALLSIPMKKLCKEDCLGLCSKCGKNLNEGKCDCDSQTIDPRWMQLKDFKNKIDNN